jgi:hypothetical protein
MAATATATDRWWVQFPDFSGGINVRARTPQQAILVAVNNPDVAPYLTVEMIRGATAEAVYLPRE